MSDIPGEVLEAYGLRGARVTPVTVGLINRTFRVERAGAPALALQELHPIFRGEVNLDLEAIARHVARRGVVTPQLVRTRAGAPFVTHGERPWRALTWLAGEVRERMSSPALSRSAAALVGRFHAAVADLEHVFAFTRPGAHDTRAHLARLEAALPEGSAEVRAVGEAILEHGAALPALTDRPVRIIHGDLKVTNLLFDAAGEAVALLDLDTLAHGTLAVELGDALRSWCNPGGENAEDARVELALYAAALEGHASTAGELLTADEDESLALGLETIALELAARFLLDAILGRYFGWDPTRYPSRPAHDLARARSQASLAASARALRGELVRLARAAYGRAAR
ncbi:MAG: phosphotransferase [Myxococcales bacterium]|nr:phosphotransferase [Myxococcales bacterium]